MIHIPITFVDFLLLKRAFFPPEIFKIYFSLLFDYFFNGFIEKLKGEIPRAVEI
jgi:hypothetical protein